MAERPAARGSRRPGASLGEALAARAERRANRGAITDPAIVLAAAARLLEARPRSVADTSKRLLDAGYPPSLVDDAVARLLALGYLDDEAFARAWVESRDRAHPRGEHILRRELGMRGVDRDLVEGVLRERREGDSVPDGTPRQDGRGGPGWGKTGPSAREHADEAAARRLIDRRRAALERVADPRRRRDRAYALLARNGFDPDVCRLVAAEVAETESTAEDGLPDETDRR